MDRQKPDSDILQAAKEAQAFNDNLSNEVRVAADLEPIMHIGEFPTSLKIDPLPGYQPQQKSGLKEKLEQMAEKEQPYQLPVGWQDHENLYNKVIDLLVTLDPDEQADLLYKMLKNEKRSNRSRLVQRIKRIIEMMEAGDLAIDIDKLHEICVRVKLEMEIEEALRDELGIDLDPIRQQVIDEEERLMDEMAYLAEEEIIEQKELPIEYAPPIRKSKYIKEVNKNYLKQNKIQNDDEGEHIHPGEEENHEMVLKNIVFKHPKSQPRLQKHHHEEELLADFNKARPNFKLNEDDIFYLIDEGYIPDNVFDDLEHHRNINVEQFILDNLLNNEQMDLRIISHRRKKLHNPRFQSKQQQQYLIPKNPLPDEHYIQQHRHLQIPKNNRIVQEVGGNLQYETMHPLERQINQPLDHDVSPNYEYVPINDQDYLNVGINKKQKDPYFNYVKQKPKKEYISHDVAQSINIVQGETQKQSINIVKNDGPVQSINIAFDETQAELNKQQELYHQYRNQKHFIDRDSFRFPQDPQYPDIHQGTILDKPPKPYMGEKKKPQYVPQGPNERIPQYRHIRDQYNPIPSINPQRPIQPLVQQRPFHTTYPFPIPPYGYQPVVLPPPNFRPIPQSIYPVDPYVIDPPPYNREYQVAGRDHRIGVTITEDLPQQSDKTNQVEIKETKQQKEHKKKIEEEPEAEPEQTDGEKHEGEEKGDGEEKAEGEEKIEGEEKDQGEENQKGEEEAKNDSNGEGFGKSLGQNALQQCLPQCIPQETNDEISINVTVKKNSKTGGYQVGVNHGKKEEEEPPAEEKAEDKGEDKAEEKGEDVAEKAEEKSEEKTDEPKVEESVLVPEIIDPYYEYYIYCQQYFQDPICFQPQIEAPPILDEFGIPPQQLDEEFVPYLPPPPLSQERYDPNDPRNFGFFDPDRKKYIETPNEIIEQEDQQLQGIQRPMRQSNEAEQERRYYDDEDFDEQYYEEDYYEEYQEEYYPYPIYDPRYQRDEEPYRNFKQINPKKKNDQIRYSLKRLKERMKKDKEVRDRQKRLKEFHVYGDYEWYKLHRKVYDKRKADEKYQDSRRDADLDDIQDRKLLIRDLDQDDDEYYERRKDKKKQKYDTAGKEFVKSLQKQEEKEQDEKESQKKLEQMGLEKKKKKTIPSNNSDDKKDQKNNQNNQSNQNDDNDENQEKSKSNGDDDEGGLQKLAANKQNNIDDKDSLVKPQSKQTNKQNRKQDIDENEPNLKHQARGNSEKKQENKDLGKDEEPLLNKGKKSNAKAALLQMQDLSCSTTTDRARLFVCNECQSNIIYKLDDDTWYLIGLVQGYKKQFHQIFKMLRSILNPQSLYTTFSKNNSICFSSSTKQKINLQKVVNSLIGKNISQSLINFPQNMTMTYFQLKFSQITNNTNYFTLEIQDQINQQLPGVYIKSIELLWNEQFKIKYQGLIQFTHAQRKFQYEIIENNDKIETIQIFLSLPHDLPQIVSTFKNYFSQEYLIMFETYLYQQNKNGPTILQMKQREANKQFEISFNLRS